MQTHTHTTDGKREGGKRERDRDREGERDRQTARQTETERVRERQRQRDRDREKQEACCVRLDRTSGRSGRKENRYVFPAYLLARNVAGVVPVHPVMIIIILPQGGALAPSETNFLTP